MDSVEIHPTEPHGDYWEMVFMFKRGGFEFRYALCDAGAYPAGQWRSLHEEWSSGDLLWDKSGKFLIDSDRKTMTFTTPVSNDSGGKSTFVVPLPKIRGPLARALAEVREKGCKFREYPCPGN